MLELVEVRSPYTPLEGRPALPVQPHRCFAATADDGARFEAFVVGSMFVPGPWILELRVRGPLLCADRPADAACPDLERECCAEARWPTIDELIAVLDSCFPRGMPVIVPFASNGPRHKYPPLEPGQPRQLMLTGMPVPVAQQQRGPQLVGGRA